MKVVSKRLQFFLFAIAVAFAIAFFADRLGLTQGIDTYIYDTCFRMRGPKAVSDRVVIVAIDEETLKTLGKWPLRRKIYARMLDYLGESAVTGFDILMTEPTADDVLLSEAAGRHGRVILPVYIDSRPHLEVPSPALAHYRTGHVHIEPGIDNIARAIFHTIYYEDKMLPSLTSAMYETATGSRVHRQELPPATTTRTQGVKILQRDIMKINFYGAAGRFQRISLADVVRGEYPPDFFKGKLVLVGLTAPGIVDEIATPFSQERNRMPGVEVFANALNNLLDGSSVTDLPGRLRITAAVFFSLLLCVLFMRVKEKWALLLWCLSLFLVTVATYSLFSGLDIWTGPSLFYLLFTFIFAATYLYRLDNAARKLESEHAAINSLLSLQPSETAKDEKGLFGFLSEGGINEKVEKLLVVERQYEKRLEETVQQRTEELSEALSMISNLTNEMILRLTKAVEYKDEGTGEHIVRVGLFAKQIAESLGMPADFVDAITFSSAMHDVGKLGIPDNVLLKPGRLTPEEMEIMKTHCVIGERILTNSPYPKMQMAAIIALNHHEKWDGSGYPNGLKGEEIPVEARILMLCDCYDALRSKRHYKPAFDHQKAFTIITEGDSRTMPGDFDPQVLRAFLESFQAFEGIFKRHPS
jgi:HD-GYP domain-containing protein (c-di-GMP phosphodiesterase class II)/CHASE2 domain-containing sensor protein